MRLLEFLTPTTVKSLASTGSLERGIAYHRDGRVEIGSVEEVRVEATVRGSMPYRVVLWAQDGRLEWDCSCPVGDRDEFCKHCVAVATAMVDDVGAPGSVAKTDDGRDREDVENLRPFVEGLDVAELVDLVIEQAGTDWQLRERLNARAAAGAGTGVDERVWRRRLESVFGPYDGFVDYRQVSEWAAEVYEALDALGDLIGAGHGEAVARLAEFAYWLCEDATGYFDDSDGYLSEIALEIASLHLNACRRGVADVVDLANRLAQLETTGPFDAFSQAASDYRDVLGAEGLAAYRGVVEPQWRRNVKRGGLEFGDYTIRQAMVGVASASGDPDQVIDIMAQDPRGYDYYTIVGVLREAGRIDEAVEWARSGLDASSRGFGGSELRESFAGMLRDMDQLDAAVDVFYEGFSDAPSLSGYRRLLDEAEVAGTRAMTRERALDRLRSGLTEGRDRDDDIGLPVGVEGADASVLVEILLFEGEIGEAWEIGSVHGCVDRLWPTLARAREVTHPRDAISVYRPRLFVEIDKKTNRSYANAVGYLSRIEELAKRLGDPEYFEALIVEVRSLHKPKRNLMALLDGNGW